MRNTSSREQRSQEPFGLGGAAKESRPGAEPTRALRLEQRFDGRRAIASGRSERIWLACNDGAMGGQVNVRDVSKRGIGIVVCSAGASLIAALKKAHEASSLVDVSRVPFAQECKARIAWTQKTDSREVRFGLHLTGPLADWF